MEPLEYHPYGITIPPNARAIIVGSFPIGKFTNPERRHEIQSHEIDYYYGGGRNGLWKLIGQAFGVSLNSKGAIINLLEKKGIAMGDVIAGCRRTDGGSRDTDLFDFQWNIELPKKIEEAGIQKIFFASQQAHSWYYKKLEGHPPTEDVIMISPSPTRLISLVKDPGYIDWEKSHPGGSPTEFRQAEYAKVFNTQAFPDISI